MTTTIFDVTPEEIEYSAVKVENKTKEFVKAYDSIYAAVSDLRINYKGEASDTFNHRIEGYRNDFSAAEKALNNYVHPYVCGCSPLKRVENEVKNKAGALSVGN